MRPLPHMYSGCSTTPGMVYPETVGHNNDDVNIQKKDIRLSYNARGINWNYGIDATLHTWFDSGM